MKTRFLDVRNCHSLLPSGHGLPTIQRLEECLRQINDKNQNHLGLIDHLIDHNKKTINRRRGSDRLVRCPLDIAQGINISERTIHTQAIERPEPSSLQLHIALDYENQTSWKAIVPLQFLLKGWGDANSGHQCYGHTILHNVSRHGTIQQFLARQFTDENDYYYVGITGRNWLLRLSEHLAEIHRGNRRTFYQAWRQSIGIDNVLFTSSLIDINLTYEDAMNWEEEKVDTIAYGPNGLNMIPGGFKGLKFLHKHRIIKSTNVSLQDRDKAISDYLRKNPRKGIPNPFISELWENDDYYLRVIEARSKTFSRDQVLRIRKLYDSGWSVSDIAEEVNAIDDAQVLRVIKGITYRRVR